MCGEKPKREWILLTHSLAERRSRLGFRHGHGSFGRRSREGNSISGCCFRTETAFFSVWDLHEYSTTYGTRIRLGWSNPFVSSFHAIQSIFAAECGDCLFLETKAFADGGVADPLHTHGGDMFFLVSCHVSSGLVVLEWMECYVNVSCCDTVSTSHKAATVTPDYAASDPHARLL